MEFHFLCQIRAATADRHGSVSEVESDEDNEEGDYTVYECPGLAPVSAKLLGLLDFMKHLCFRRAKWK